ncbi:hypothetical protein PFISCL1PPCAC_24187, partial [Pristionchus fissidentatus]
ARVGSEGRGSRGSEVEGVFSRFPFGGRSGGSAESRTEIEPIRFLNGVFISDEGWFEFILIFFFFLFNFFRFLNLSMGFASFRFVFRCRLDTLRQIIYFFLAIDCFCLRNSRFLLLFFFFLLSF